MKNLPMYIMMMSLAACGGSGSDSEDTSLQNVNESTEANDSLQDAQVVEVGSRISGSLNEATDAIDIYTFSVSEGDVINLDLSGDAGTDFDLYLYSDNYSVEKNSVNDGSSTESIDYTVESGVTSLNAEVYAYEGSGNYQLNVIRTDSSGGDNSSTDSSNPSSDLYCVDLVSADGNFIIDDQGGQTPGSCSGTYVSECQEGNLVGLGSILTIHYSETFVNSNGGHDFFETDCVEEVGGTYFIGSEESEGSTTVTVGSVVDVTSGTASGYIFDLNKESNVFSFTPSESGEYQATAEADNESFEISIWECESTCSVANFFSSRDLIAGETYNFYLTPSEIWGDEISFTPKPVTLTIELL